MELVDVPASTTAYLNLPAADFTKKSLVQMTLFHVTPAGSKRISIVGPRPEPPTLAQHEQSESDEGYNGKDPVVITVEPRARSSRLDTSTRPTTTYRVPPVLVLGGQIASSYFFGSHARMFGSLLYVVKRPP